MIISKDKWRNIDGSQRHPGYNDDGILLRDENKIVNMMKLEMQGVDFLIQRLINNPNLVEKSANDQNRSNDRECKYCKLAFGFSRLYPYMMLC